MKKFLVVFATVVLIMAGTLSAKEWKKIRIGVEGAYPPFSYITPDGKLTGFDIDIAWALCKQMNAECELLAQDWDGIIPGLLVRKYDAIIASMSITEDRKRKVAFTNAYYKSATSFIQRKGLIKVFSDDALEGKRVGVQRATNFDSFLTETYGSKVTVVRYGTQDELIMDLIAGRVDLMVGEKISVSEGFLKTPKGKDFEFIGPDYKEGKWFGMGAGIAIRKQDQDLVEKFNRALDEIKANGVYKAVQDKYFDFDIFVE